MPKPISKEPKQFKFRKGATLGFSAAEQDTSFLDECFIDNGFLEIATASDDARMFLNGRTGSGKSALLYKVAAQRGDQAIVVDPESLCLSHIADSTLLRFFEDLGVRLDIFYKLLWKHVLTVELLKRKFKVDSEATKTSFISRLTSTWKKDKRKMQALQYLQEWGDTFWESTEYRIKETTQTLENKFKGILEIKGLGSITIGGKTEGSMSEQVKAEIIQRGRQIVSQIQMRELNDIMDWMSNDVFVDEQHPYFVLIDKLDEDWVENRLRYKLIAALLDAAKDFLHINNVKVIIAIRRDLIELIIKLNRDAGYQEEKYRSLCLNLQWSEEDIQEVIESRMNRLIREQYTNTPVRFSDVMPAKLEGVKTIKYLLERTFLRPRDAIAFMNHCLEKCIDKPKLTPTMISSAELEYSKDRFRSIGDEWHTQYPEILDVAKALLSNRPERFKIEQITDDDMDNMTLMIWQYEGTLERGEIWSWCKSYLDGITTRDNLRLLLVSVFYKVGFIGVRTENATKVKWSYLDEHSIRAEDLTVDLSVTIHPTFWRVLRTRPK